MATIKWATGHSGTWTTASDWTGGIVPGAGDTAVIDAAASSKYTITSLGPVTVAGLDLEQAKAVLKVESSFGATQLALDAGSLLLEGGSSLSGTVTDTQGSLLLGKGDITLSNVTWHGLLDPAEATALNSLHTTVTIAQGITLTDAAGTGPGSASFVQQVVLDNVAELNNATFGFSTLSMEHTQTLTLGASLTLDGVGGTTTFNVAAGGAVINDGTIVNGGYVIGRGPKFPSFTNNGQITGNFITSGVTFQNNGTITEGASQTVNLDVSHLLAPGAKGVIDLAGGNIVWGAALTTPELLNLFTAQHVTGSGSYGFGVEVDDNTGQTLTVGQGSALGTLSAGTIMNGVVIDQGGNQGAYQNVALESSSTTLTDGGYWYSTILNGASTVVASTAGGNGLQLTNTTLNGVGTIDVGTGSQSSYLNLDGATITGIGGSGQVAINLEGTGSIVNIAAGQSLTGYQFALGQGTGLEAGQDEVLANAVVNVAGTSTNAFISSPAYQTTLSLGAGFVANIDAGASLEVQPAGSETGPLLNDGAFNVSGTLAIGASSVTGTGVFALSGSSGSVAVLQLAHKMAAGETVQFTQGPAMLSFLAAAAATGFQSTLSGFASGDAITFTGETLAAASFNGTNLVVTLHNGGTISLATSTAETGALSVTNSHGIGTITFAGAPERDWLTHGALPTGGNLPAFDREPGAYALAHSDAPPGDWLPILHHFGR